MLAAALPASILPTAVEPVKVSLATFGLVTNSPTGQGLCGHKINDPLRHARFFQNLERLDRAKGVASAGFRTTVQPAASAGPTFRVIIETG